MHRLLTASGVIALSFITLSFAVAAPDADNVHLYGTLVAEPCVLKPGDETIPISFDKIVDKYLYSNQRTPSKPFLIHLQECDLSIGRQLNISFNGEESIALPGLLAVQQKGMGIAIGIENTQGKLIPLNRGSEKIDLQKGNMALTFSTFVQGEPEALRQHTLVRGEFSATATFKLDYN